MQITYTDNSPLILAALASAKTAALAAAGNSAVEFARMYVPVDTGQLRDSLSCVVSDDGAVIGSGLDYAAHVEFGTLGRPGAYYLRNAMTLHTDVYAALMHAVLTDSSAADVTAADTTVADASVTE